MISYIKGTLSEINKDNVVLECQDIGYEINVSEILIQSLPAIGSKVKLYTYMQVKDDGVNLFGFLNKDNLSVFKLLLSVSGVGPKGALAILSCLSADDLRIAVSTQDAKAISKAQGIGSKTAQRIIIDLKDKLTLDHVFFQDDPAITTLDNNLPGNRQITMEAIEALISLGYSSSEAAQAVKAVAPDAYSDVESCLKAALKVL